MNTLSQKLGPWSASAIVVGSIIGTGIFLKTAVMAQLMGSSRDVLLAWVVSGMLSFAGALTYAELCARLPRAGGEYALLKESMGPTLAFTYGWTRFWIGSPGTIAAYAVGSATFLSGVTPLSSPKAAALAFIAVFTGINCLKVELSSVVQNALTALKILLIIGLVIGIYILGAPYAADIMPMAPPSGLDYASSFGLAMIAALWAFDGWNNLPMVGEEVRNPQRNIPIALTVGLLVVLALYLSANLSYFHVLGLGQVQSAYSAQNPHALPVATLAASSFLGKWSVPVLSMAFVISALGAMNGSIMTGARVPYAMARDGLFFKGLSHAGEHTHVPTRAVLVQGGIASALALTGTFDQLTDYVVVASWLYYALTTVGLFVLRSRDPYVVPAFKVPGYPVVPGLFILGSALLIGNSAYRAPKEALIGLGLIALGVPFYMYFKGQQVPWRKSDHP